MSLANDQSHPELIRLHFSSGTRAEEQTNVAANIEKSLSHRQERTRESVIASHCAPDIADLIGADVRLAVVCVEFLDALLAQYG
jgi:hypothetical protein